METVVELKETKNGGGGYKDPGMILETLPTQLLV